MMVSGETLTRFILITTCIQVLRVHGTLPYRGVPPHRLITNGVAGLAVKSCVCILPLNAAVKVTTVGKSTLAGPKTRGGEMELPCGTVTVSGTARAAGLLLVSEIEIARAATMALDFAEPCL